MADTPVEALLARVEELARRWAVALILARPLARIGEIPLEQLAAEAPELFAQAIRALASEAALERLLVPGEPGSPTAGAAGSLGLLAGARDTAALVGACEALRGVLWEALLDELRDPQPRQVADLSDRLAAVCAALAAALLAPPTEQSPAVSEPSAEPASPASPWVEQPRIEIRDVRGESDEGPSAWIGSIGRRLERYAEDELPFAVLLVEVADVERLVHAGSPAEVSELIGRVEGALSEELRPADLLTRESQGRYWLVTPETDGVGVRMLAERLARSVRASVHDHGTPLEVAIGIAVCPDDGRDAATLAAHADAGVYAARASGRTIAPADEPR